MMTKNRGWPRESRAHALAARGIPVRASGQALSAVRSQVEFPRGDSLDSKVAIVVPGTFGDGVISDVEHRSRAREVQAFLSRLFGGYTATEGMGGWVDASGNLVEEPVYVVWASVDMSDYLDKDREMEAFVLSKLREWDQEAIGVELDDELFFVS